MTINIFYASILNNSRSYFIEKISNGSKKHTIRNLKYKRLPFPIVANHSYTSNRGPYNRSDFEEAKNMITGYEVIEIEYVSEDSELYELHGYNPVITVEGKILSENEALQLAANDGFTHWSLFCDWFSRDCKKIILHFTDLRYGEDN